jgi:hypothetical protein
VFGLGVVALYQGNYTLAQEYFTQLLKQAQKSENKAGSGNYLTGLAVAAAGNNQPERAVILDAAAQAFFEAGGNTYPSREFKDFENLLQAAQEQVGPVRITQLLDRGRGMIFEEAIAYGLGEDLAE